MAMQGMMKDVRTDRSGGLAGAARASALAFALIAAANPVLAQTTAQTTGQVGDFRLPSASPTPTSRAQGPVDPDNPYASRPRDNRPTPAPPNPGPAPAPAVTAAPAAPIVLRSGDRPAPGSPSLIGRRITPAPRDLPAVTAGASQAADAPDAAVRPGSEVLVPSAEIPANAPPAASTAVTATNPAAVPESSSWWPWLAGLAALAAAAAVGLFALRRRAPREYVAPEIERPVLADPVLADPVLAVPVLAVPVLADPVPAASMPPAPPLPAPALSPKPSLAEPREAEPLALALVATRMSATLVNTALSYRIALTNTSGRTLEDLAVSGDMIAAHASRDVRGQLALDGQPLAPLHRMAALAPGETAELEGQLRLPLAAITPIRQGEAALFIPLARFRIEIGLTRSSAMVRSFVIGQPPVAGGTALLPFRLDLGPRLYAPLGQRELIPALG